MIRIGGHRRFTANHTLHLDLPGSRLFIKLNPNRNEATAEVVGYARLRGHYPVPARRARLQLGGWTALAYDRVGTSAGRHLLLDEINRADRAGSPDILDECLDAVFGHYRATIAATRAYAPLSTTIGKLYGDRARLGGRLNRYYRDRPMLRFGEGTTLCANGIAATHLVMNGRTHAIDFTQLTSMLRERLHSDRMEWTAITQGDPTDLNIGWTPATGPVWFDYDTGGRNALPGEFACFLVYQQLHGGWIVPTYNPLAYTDHPAALQDRKINEPVIRVHQTGPVGLAIDWCHTPSPARQHTINRYLQDVVIPTAAELGIGDLMHWLRPWFVMRILAVFHLGDLATADAALHLAYLALILDQATTIDHLFPMSAAWSTR